MSFYNNVLFITVFFVSFWSYAYGRVDICLQDRKASTCQYGLGQLGFSNFEIGSTECIHQIAKIDGQEKLQEVLECTIQRNEQENIYFGYPSESDDTLYPFAVWHAPQGPRFLPVNDKPLGVVPN